MFGKKKNDNKLDVSSINELVRVAKKVVDIFFILSIFILIFIIGRLLIDWGVLRAIKTILKILLPFFLGIIISWLLNPIVERLENKGWKRSISTFVVFFTFLILLALFFYIVIPSIGRQIQDAIGMVPKVLDNFRAWMNNFFDNLTNHYDYDFTTVKDNIYSAISNYSNNITEGIPTFLVGLITSLISGSLVFVVALFIAFYMLFDFNNVRNTLVGFLPKKTHNYFMEVTDRLNVSLKNYVLGTIFVTIILFVFQSLGFLIAGLKAPLVFGLICAITNIIPYVGPYIGGIPAVLVGFTISPLVGILTLVSVIISQFLESYILTPIILSKTMKLHPVTIIIGLLIFEHFFGIIGMLVSTPVIACLKIIIQFFDEKYDIFEKIQG